jgi:hypothetical protein
MTLVQICVFDVPAASGSNMSKKKRKEEEDLCAK